MKKLRSALSLFLAAAFIFTCTACGNKNTGSQDSGIDGDFFTDDEVVISNDTDGADSKTGASDSNAAENSSANTSKGNKIGGKSWKEVLAGMPKKLRGTTVTVYNWNPAYEYSGAPAAIEKFEKQTGIKVEWKTENFNTYLSKLASMVASDTAPDVARLRNPFPTGLLSIQPITATGYDFSDDAWDKGVMKDYTFGNKTYGLSLKNTHIGSVAMLMYNSSLISKYDLDDPYKLWKSGKWTWDTFIKMCGDYKKAANAEFACGGEVDWSVWAAMRNNSGPIGFDGSKFYNNTSDAKFLEVTQSIADIYNTNHLFKLWSADEFNSGKCLFWSGGAVYTRRKNAYMGSLKSAGTLKTVPYPAVEGQDKYYQFTSNEYEAYGVVKGAKNAEAVPYFLRWFMDADNYDLNAFFCNAQTLEVYNWCMSQENKIWVTCYAVDKNYDSANADDFSKINETPGAQIASFVKSNSSIIDARVNRYNQALSQLK